MRLRLDLAYDGTEFHGWAAQAGLRTVQGELEDWLTRILRQPVSLTVAGRTDAGVHARGQVAHFDFVEDQGEIAAESRFRGWLLQRLSGALPSDIAVKEITEAPAGFDARFSAIWRRYVYRLADGTPDPLHRNFVTPVRQRLDIERLNLAAQQLLGLHDFVAFCKQREGATTIRNLLEIGAIRDESGLIEVTVRADAFCHSQVRSLLGALVAVAAGQRDEAWLAGLLRREQRAGEVPVFPAAGLCLEEVGYPTDELLAVRAVQARQSRSREEL